MTLLFRDRWRFDSLDDREAAERTLPGKNFGSGCPSGEPPFVTLSVPEKRTPEGAGSPKVIDVLSPPDPPCPPPTPPVKGTHR